MNLNQIIINVINKYQDLQPNMKSESFRKELADKIEQEVDKYCVGLIEAVSKGSFR